MKKKIFAILSLALLGAILVSAAACGPKIADNTEHFDSITKTLKLNKDFSGKKLLGEDSNGIGSATLNGDTTDGDTSTFSLAEGGYVRVRYQGVDTPESTYEVQKWGKAASKFTNERLHLATEIVLESTTSGVPKKDSVGQRSLCYVWYKTEKDDFKCLNLELVENGYSENKEGADNPYYSYFQKAETFARGIKLRIWSDLDDPLFDTSPIPFSLRDFDENEELYHAGTKVFLDAYVTDSSTAASSGAVTLIIAQYDEESRKQYKLTLYAGHTNSTGSMRIGDLYHLSGTLDKYNENWQLTGVMVDQDDKGKEDASWRKQLSYFLTFDASSPYYTGEKSSNCYGDVTVTEIVSLEDKTLTFKGTAPKIDDTTPEFTFTVTVPDDYADTIKKGSTLSVNGCYQFEANSGNLTIVNYSDITIK